MNKKAVLGAVTSLFVTTIAILMLLLFFLIISTLVKTLSNQSAIQSQTESGLPNPEEFKKEYSCISSLMDKTIITGSPLKAGYNFEKPFDFCPPTQTPSCRPVLILSENSVAVYDPITNKLFSNKKNIPSKKQWEKFYSVCSSNTNLLKNNLPFKQNKEIYLEEVYTPFQDVFQFTYFRIPSTPTLSQRFTISSIANEIVQLKSSSQSCSCVAFELKKPKKMLQLNSPGTYLSCLCR